VDERWREAAELYLARASLGASGPAAVDGREELVQRLWHEALAGPLDVEADLGLGCRSA
jgi:hypothetical protein